jgi:hypothetical protein
MNECISNAPAWMNLVAVFAVLFVEMWIGKRKPLGASSLIGILITIAAAVLVRLINRERANGNGTRPNRS